MQIELDGKHSTAATGTPETRKEIPPPTEPGNKQLYGVLPQCTPGYARRPSGRWSPVLLPDRRMVRLTYHPRHLNSFLFFLLKAQAETSPRPFDRGHGVDTDEGSPSLLIRPPRLCDNSQTRSPWNMDGVDATCTSWSVVFEHIDVRTKVFLPCRRCRSCRTTLDQYSYRRLLRVMFIGPSRP